MLRIDRQAKTLQPLATPSLTEAGLKERVDLQDLIRRQPEAFFAELGEELLLVGEEVCPAECVDDRIDLLAVDKEGAAVVIELKRGSHWQQLAQALGYAAMVSWWPGTELLDLANQRTGKPVDELAERVEAFLDVETERLNHRQRVILVAEDFDFEVLACAKWLGESHGVGIACYRLDLASDGQREFLSLSRVFPMTGLEDHAIRRSRRTAEGGAYPDWDEALTSVQNAAVVAFFRAELGAGAEANLNHRCLMYRDAARVRRWWCYARTKHLYVKQQGRFEGDQGHWLKHLGPDAEIGEVSGGDGLRFTLSTPHQLDAFKQGLAVAASMFPGQPTRELRV